MSKKMRTLLAVLSVEVILGGIWLYLANLGQSQPQRIAPDFQATLGSTMGTAMGAFLGFGILLYFIAARRNREG